MARSFNGSTDFMTYAGTLITAAPLTLAAWFYVNNTAAAVKTIIDIGGDNGAVLKQAFLIYASSTGFYAATQADGSFASATSTATLSQTTWYHGCGVFAASNDRRAFINGANKGTNNTNYTPNAAYVQRIRIGQRANAYDNQKMNGLLAEAAAWNVALGDDEVAILATGISPLAVRPGSLVNYWPIIGKYSPEIDVVGGFDMTLSGTPAAAAHPRVRYPVGHVAR